MAGVPSCIFQAKLLTDVLCSVPGSKAQAPTATYGAQGLSTGRTREINQEVIPLTLTIGIVRIVF